MTKIRNWLGAEVEVAKSAGGVIALANPWENLVRGSVSPWPTPELIQKLYQSRHKNAFQGWELGLATKTLGFYSDLQSVHSEDAITWSVFGPLVYADPPTRKRFVEDLLGLIDVPGTSGPANVWLWRRLPHPDTLVSGGPEIDFGIQTENVFLLGEAKWGSPVGVGQGVEGNKSQLTLRHEFCAKYGRRLLPGITKFIVLGVSPDGGLLPRLDNVAEGIGLHARDITWDKLVRHTSHPCSTELQLYLPWKRDPLQNV